MAAGSSQLQPLDVLNLRDHIENQIRDAVLQGTFQPGERLVESAIAEQLGVSRAPVREALSALEREGIVVQIPRRGYFVVEFTDKDIEEVYSLRLLLEVGALRRAVDRVTEQDIAQLQRLVDALGEAALQKDDPVAIVTRDLEFHEHICRLADHGRLYLAWNKLHLQTQVLIGLTSKTHYDHPEQPKELHQRILNTICNKDLERAEAIMTEHLLDAQQRAVMALEKLRQSDAE